MKQAHFYKKTNTSSSILMSKALSYPGGKKPPKKLPSFVLWLIFMALRASNCIYPVRWRVKKSTSVCSGLCSLHCDSLCKGYGACSHCLGHWKTAHAPRCASWNGLGMLLSPSVITLLLSELQSKLQAQTVGKQKCQQSSWQVNLSYSLGHQNPKKWSGLVLSHLCAKLCWQQTSWQGPKGNSHAKPLPLK